MVPIALIAFVAFVGLLGTGHIRIVAPRLIEGAIGC